MRNTIHFRKVITTSTSIAALQACLVFHEPAQAAQGFEQAVQAALGNGCRGFLAENEFVTNTSTVIGAESVSSLELSGLAGPGVGGVTEFTFLPPNLPSFAIFSFDQAGTVTNLDADLDPVKDFASNNGTIEASAIQAFTLSADLSRTVNIFNERRPVNGLLGTQLSQYCTAAAAPVSLIQTRTIERTRIFNTEGALIVTTSNAGSYGSVPAGGTASQSATQGAGQSRASVISNTEVTDDWISVFYRKAKRLFSGGAQLASVDNAYMPADGSFALLFDVAKGYSDIKRTETILEGPYKADAEIVGGSVAVIIPSAISGNDTLMFGGSYFFEDIATNGPAELGRRSSFKNEIEHASFFVNWAFQPFSLGLEEPLTVSLRALGAWGDGTQRYERIFSATFRPDLASDRTVTLVDALLGQFDHEYQSAGFFVHLEQPVGPFVFRPYVGFVRTETQRDGLQEQVNDGADDGLALRYLGVEDEWIETRFGAQISFTTDLSRGARLHLSASADAVFLDDEGTPVHRASFVQDLRPVPHVISYRVDDLDDRYYDLSVTAAVEFDSQVTAYVSAYRREGHDYLDVEGVVVGLRVLH